MKIKKNYLYVKRFYSFILFYLRKNKDFMKMKYWIIDGL